MPDDFPGTLYDGDGSLLSGDGPEFTPELDAGLLCKALISHEPEEEDGIATLAKGDRLWLLPDSLGTPAEPPVPVLAELADVVRRGNKVGLIARNPEVYTVVRDGLMLLLKESAGQA